MKDERIVTLANNLLDYSVKLEKGDKIYIEWRGNDAVPLIKELIKGATRRGATPIWVYSDDSLMRQMLMTCSEEQIKNFADLHLKWMKEMDAYIGVRASGNVFDLADIPSDKLDLYNKFFIGPVHITERVTNTKWCILRYPNDAYAQLAKTSQEAFEEFYFKVCNLDYSRLNEAMDPLVDLMQSTDKVRIKGPETDLTFSVKGIPAVKCAGTRNIPDGEIYTAPVKNSINGTIRFNAPTNNMGTVYNNIRLTFRDGKIIEATCDNDNEALNKILDTDEGARYCGEFAFGLNPYIKNAMLETLFDEKIHGSIHLTPGACYDDASNGNKSAIHLDLVLIQTEEHGGGEIYFDNKLIRKDGKFVHPKLSAALSVEALTK